jgi:hypothetical protein
MNTLVGDNIGLTHLISGLFALVFGGGVLILKKGTTLHMRGLFYFKKIIPLNFKLSKK